MSGRRIARLNEQLRRELSDLIRTQLRDPRVGPVTVTAVEVAQDLGSARVFVRTLASGDEAAEAMRGLEAAAPFLRGLLGRSLEIRRIPELRFREDRSLAQAQRIEEVLADVLPPEAAAARDEGAEQEEGGARAGGDDETEGGEADRSDRQPRPAGAGGGGEGGGEGGSDADDEEDPH